MTKQSRSGRWHGDVLAGLVLLAIAGLGLWLTTGFRDVPAMLSQNVPPTFFPRLVLAGIAILSVVLIARGLKRAAEPRPRIGATVGATALVIVLTPLAIGAIGTWLTIAAVCLAVPWLWGERRWRRFSLVAIGMPAFVYLVFARALELRFPVGRLIEPLF